MSEQYQSRPSGPPLSSPALPQPAATPPPAYRPLWWLWPFLAGLALGLSLLGLELLLRLGQEATKGENRKNDEIKQQYATHRAP